MRARAPRENACFVLDARMYLLYMCMRQVGTLMAAAEQQGLAMARHEAINLVALLEYVCLSRCAWCGQLFHFF